MNTGHGSAGGAGGSDCIVSWTFGGMSGTDRAYGGGARGSTGYYDKCDAGNYKCNVWNYGIAYGSHGAGGRSGNGIGGSGVNGASAVSGSEFDTNSLSARCIIGAYNE